MMNVPFLNGKDIYLRELRVSDLEGNWYQWFNDEEVTRFQNKGVFPNTREKQQAYFEKISNSSTDVVLAIIDKAGEAHVGNVGLHNIDWVHRSAEIGIVIGEKSYWKKGYGTQAWNLISMYGIKRLGLHRLYAWILKENIPSLKAAEKSGFKKEGEIRDVLFKNGNYHAMCYLNLTGNELVPL